MVWVPSNEGGYLGRVCWRMCIFRHALLLSPITWAAFWSSSPSFLGSHGIPFCLGNGMWCSGMNTDFRHRQTSYINSLNHNLFICLHLDKNSIHIKLERIQLWNFMMKRMNIWASQVVLVVKNWPVNAEDIRDEGSIPGLGRSPGGEHGNPFQYSRLENLMDRGPWWAVIHTVTKSGTQLKWLSSSSSRWVYRKWFAPGCKCNGSHGIRRHLLLGRKAITNPDSV